MKKKKILRKLTLLAIMGLGLIGCGKKIEKREKKKGPKDSRPTLNNSKKTTSNSNHSVIDKELLLSAISANDTNLVKSALEQNSTIEYHFENGETPLTFALKFAKAQVVSMIIDKAENLNFTNKGKQSPLQLAVRFDKYLALTKLLTKKANIDQEDAKGRTALFYSLEEGKERHFVYLIRNGANLNIKLDDRGPSLIRALQNLRFSKGLDLVRSINSHDKIHQSFLIRAIKEGDVNFLNYLLINFPFYQGYIQTNNILIHTITLADVNQANRLTDLLLKWGAEPNFTEPEPPIITAAKMRRNDIVGILSSFKADLTLEDAEGLNLLDHAVANLNVIIIRELYLPIRAALRDFSEEERAVYVRIFKNACQYLPEEQIDGMTFRSYIQGRKIISQFLNCQ